MTDAKCDLSWKIEEVCLNLRPPTFETLMDGWLIRSSGGPVRRINAACRTKTRSARFEPVLETAEQIYSQLGRPSIFKVLSIDDDIDSLLDSRGYRSEARSKVLLGDHSDVEADTSMIALCENRTDVEWFEAWATIGKAQSSEARAVFETTMKAIVLPKAFAALKIDGQIISMAYGVLHHKILGIDSVATRADRRGQGAAKKVISALQAWASNQGVHRCCLAVEADNLPALSLYRKCGLDQHLYGYHYRIKVP